MLELFTYDFMQRSLLAAAMVGGLCSFIGVFVVLRGLAFVGAGTSHAAFAGVALGYLIGWSPLGLAILFGSLSAGALTKCRKYSNAGNSRANGGCRALRSGGSIFG